MGLSSLSENSPQFVKAGSKADGKGRTRLTLMLHATGVRREGPPALLEFHRSLGSNPDLMVQ